ncbi:hypothetical protein HDV00_010978 [Rhizophlyctis rosea]|nr:hypothetical protein HDV00_010978 [Rhizophlyctis rosea]
MKNGQYKRGIEIQESKKSKSMSMETIKKLTGYDYLRARRLYENGCKFIFVAMLFLCVNDLPKITETDKGTWRRILVTMFTSTFVETLEEIDETKHHYLGDPNAKHYRKREAPFYMSLLIEYYHLFRDEGNLVPQIILEDTLRFQKESDFYGSFFEECCIVEKHAKIHVTDLYKGCVDWVRNLQNPKIRADKNDMLKWFEKLAGDSDEGIIYKEKVKVSKKVDSQTLSKVSTGFRNIRLNKWRDEREVEILPDSDEGEEGKEGEEEGPAQKKQRT